MGTLQIDLRELLGGGMIYDYIIVGSGLGGLSVACLLTKDGKKVLVLEKGISPGGCASTYSKNGYRFEAGATTLVGLGSKHPVGILLGHLGIELRSLRLNPTMEIHGLGDGFFRTEERNRWIPIVKGKFGGGKRMEWFWRVLFFLSDCGWDLSIRYKTFPPQSLIDFFSLLKSFQFSDLFLLCSNFFSIQFLIRFFGLNNLENFKKFVEEQLLITTQSGVSDTPIFIASLGLTYPNLDNYYLLGGIGSLAEELVLNIQKNQGEYRDKSEVTHIEQIPGGFMVHTKKDKFQSKELISNIPIWNLAELYEGVGKTKLLTSSQAREEEIWGAFTMGIVVDAKGIPKEVLHHQVHVGELPFGGGNSIFLSLSAPEDSKRCKADERVIALSTHLKNPETWNRKSPDYQEKKRALQEVIYNRLETVLPWFRRSGIRFASTASPATWQTWTGRKFGRVGGIPARYFFNPFRYLGPIGPSQGLYLTGDTVYPGQGIPAVVLGGLHLWERLRKRD